MTYKTISTIHDILINEYNRVHNQVQVVDSACKRAHRLLDDYLEAHPELYTQFELYFSMRVNIHDDMIIKLTDRWRKLSDISLKLQAKDKELEKALEEFEQNQW